MQGVGSKLVDRRRTTLLMMTPVARRIVRCPQTADATRNTFCSGFVWCQKCGSNLRRVRGDSSGPTFRPFYVVWFNPFKPSDVKSLYFINFWHSGTLALSNERQSARMSKIKNGIDEISMALNALVDSFLQQSEKNAGIKTTFLYQWLSVTGCDWNIGPAHQLISLCRRAASSRAPIMSYSTTGARPPLSHNQSPCMLDDITRYDQT